MLTRFLWPAPPMEPWPLPPATGTGGGFHGMQAFRSRSWGRGARTGTSTAGSAPFQRDPRLVAVLMWQLAGLAKRARPGARPLLVPCFSPKWDSRPCGGSYSLRRGVFRRRWRSASPSRYLRVEIPDRFLTCASHLPQETVRGRLGVLVRMPDTAHRPQMVQFRQKKQHQKPRTRTSSARIIEAGFMEGKYARASGTASPAPPLSLDNAPPDPAKIRTRAFAGAQRLSPHGHAKVDRPTRALARDYGGPVI